MSIQITTPWWYVLTMAKVDAMSHWWVAILANYNFQLYYRAGKNNNDADALLKVSWPRCVPHTLGTHHWVTAVAVWGMQEAALKGNVSPIEACSCDLCVLDPIGDSPQFTCMTMGDWHQAQWADPVLGIVISKMQHGTLGQCPLKLTDPPKLWHFLWEHNHFKLRWGILHRNHRSPISIGLDGHTLGNCSKRVSQQGQPLRSWANAWPDVQPFLLASNGYTGKRTHWEVLPVHHLQGKATEGSHGEYPGHPSPGTSAYWLPVPWAGEGKEENVLVVKEHFTHYTQAYVTQSQITQTMAKAPWDNFIVHYRLSEKILLDQERISDSELIVNLCKITGTKKFRTSLYHPQTNGQCQRFNSTLINILGTLPPECKADWKGSIGVMVHAYNCTQNSTTGFSPYFFMYGRQPLLPINVTIRLTLKSITAPTSTKYIQKLRECIRLAL